MPAALLERFRHFLDSHELKSAEVDGVLVPYYSCGSGARTLLTFCGGHSTPYTAWRTVETYERDHRVVVIDISGFNTVHALSTGINAILSREGIGRVVLHGTSLAGLIAQIYLKHNPDRVDGVVLINTRALKPGGDRPWTLLVLKLLPGFGLKALFGRRLRAYFNEALADPRARDGALFGVAHLNEVLAHHFTKKKVVNLLSVLMEFGREGLTREDLGGWGGKTLVITSEDDRGHEDVDWFVATLPGAVSHSLPPGLGHLPQLVHRARFESLVRTFLGELD